MQGLEPLFQELRIRKIWSHIPQGGVLVDLGCDHEMTLIKRAQSLMKKVIGVDWIAKPKKTKTLEIVQADLTKKLPLASNSADVVTMLAVLEHLVNPDKVVKEVYRILKPGGVFLVTVPSAQAEKILPTLATFRLVRQDMIDQHENYFTHAHLRRITRQAGFKSIEVETWELGFNTFMKAVK